MRNTLGTMIAMLLLAAPVAAQVAIYCVEDADSNITTRDSGVIKAYSYDQRTTATLASVSAKCESGQTGVLTSEVKAAAAPGPVYQGGTWNGTDYVLPVQYQTPTAGTVEAVVASARLMRQVLQDWRAELHESNVTLFHSMATVEWVHDLLWRVEAGCARIFLAENAQYSYTEREKLGDEVASGPSDTGASDLPGILAAAEAVGPTFPTLGDNTCWIAPDNLPGAARVDLTVTANQLNSATNTLGDAPSRAQLIDGSWIADIK